MRIYSAMSVWVFLLLLTQNVWSATIHHSSEEVNCDDLKPTNDCSAYWNGDVPPLLIMSFDGFRADYLERNSTATPNLHLIKSCSVQAPYMVPSFPSKTFPNHYSIVTGLYPESHGIVSNDFYDPDLNKSFTIKSGSKESEWWGGEPLWNTVVRQGKKSATYFWPGSEAVINGTTPTYKMDYDKTKPFENRVQQIIEWLTLPFDERPAFLTLYFEEPDSTGHQQGPEGDAVIVQAARVDGQVEILFQGLREKGIMGCVNVIIVSDHGMASAPKGEKIVDARDYVPNLPNRAKVYYGQVGTIMPYNNTQEERDEIAHAMECQTSHMRIQDKKDLPLRMHYHTSNRIPDLIAEIDVGYRFVYNGELWNVPGQHGWDNLHKDMLAIFMATGPSFQEKVVATPFQNVELYSFMCDVLGLTPAPNNGTRGALHYLLKSPSPVVHSSHDAEVHAELDLTTYPRNPNLFNERFAALQKCAVRNVESTNYDPKKFSEETDYLKENNPWGIPKTPESHVERLSLLSQQEFITVFDSQFGLPVLSSFLLHNAKWEYQGSNTKWLFDPRVDVSESQRCQQWSLPESVARYVELAPLYPTGLAKKKKDSLLMTNAYPMPRDFYNELQLFYAKLAEVSETKGPLHVLSGPIVNPISSNDSVEYPTKFYFIVTACIDSTDWTLETCPIEYIDQQAFIFPMKPRYSAACITSDDFFAYHVATLQDVEGATGWNFFPDLSFLNKARLASRTPLASTLVIDPTQFNACGYAETCPVPAPRKTEEPKGGNSAMTANSQWNLVLWNLITALIIKLYFK